jgi:hypothetical protein
MPNFKQQGHRKDSKTAAATALLYTATQVIKVPTQQSTDAQVLYSTTNVSPAVLLFPPTVPAHLEGSTLHVQKKNQHLHPSKQICNGGFAVEAEQKKSSHVARFISLRLTITKGHKSAPNKSKRNKCNKLPQACKSSTHTPNPCSLETAATKACPGKQVDATQDATSVAPVRGDIMSAIAAMSAMLQARA